MVSRYFVFKSEEQSKEIQKALFADDCKWAAGQTEYWDAGSEGTILQWDKVLTCGFSYCGSGDEYVVVSGAIYKKGEEPKPKVNKFKVGDKVRCIESSFFGNVNAGEEYIVASESPDYYELPSIQLAGEDDMHWYESRFELVQPEPEVLAVFDDLVRPTLGLRPRYISDLDYVAVHKTRLVEILEAMLRYAQADKEIPDEWADEYDEIREMLNEYYSQ